MVRFWAFLVEINVYPRVARELRVAVKRTEEIERSLRTTLARTADNSAALTINVTQKNDLSEPVVRFRSFLVEISGFEPLASSLRTRRSTN